MTTATRTPEQQAAYDRLVGTAATVREQRAAGIIDGHGNYTGPTAAPRGVLATATHEGHDVTVTRDEPVSVGNGMPYTVVRVGGIYMGEVIGSRREDDGTLTARIRVPSGYDKLTYSGNGPDFSAALAQLAPHIVAAYRRTYPRAA